MEKAGPGTVGLHKGDYEQLETCSHPAWVVPVFSLYLSHRWLIGEEVNETHLLTDNRSDIRLVH